MKLGRMSSRKAAPVTGATQVSLLELFGQQAAAFEYFPHAVGFLVAALLAWLLLRPKRLRGEPFNQGARPSLYRSRA